MRPDVIAGVVIWSVVVPQAVAYAQIAGLPPQAGLMAAPGALADALEREAIELRLGAVYAQAAKVVRRSGLADRLDVEPTIDAAVGRSSFTPHG